MHYFRILFYSVTFFSFSCALEMLGAEITSYRQFQERVKDLKPYPVLYHKVIYEQMPRSIDRTKIHIDMLKSEKPCFTVQELLNAIAATKNALIPTLKNGLWVDNGHLDEKDFNKTVPINQLFNSMLSKGYYHPYEKSLLLEDGEKVISIGDLHGGLQSLMAVLNSIVDPTTFKLNDKKTHLVCLGDLVDSGKNSTEVLILLNKLMAANPSNVHVIRGNHEDLQLNKQYCGFVDELQQKFTGITTQEINQIASFYNLLPTALWLGNRRFSTIPFLNKMTDWRLACHGGVEIGDVNINTLLSKTKRTAYKRVGEYHKDNNISIIKRAALYETLKNSLKKDFERISQKTKDTLDPVMTDFVPLSPGVGQELRHYSKNDVTSPDLKIGYYFDFINENENETVQTPLEYLQGFNLRYGKAVMHKIFALWSSFSHRIIGMIRGHQHADNTEIYSKFPLMERIFKNGGLFSSWASNNKQDPLAHGVVTTMGVAPDTAYGLADEVITDECPKKYPGAVAYTALELKFEKGWFFNSMKSSIHVHDSILPALYTKIHNRIMQENEALIMQKNEPKPATNKDRHPSCDCCCHNFKCKKCDN